MCGCTCMWQSEGKQRDPSPSFSTLLIHVGVFPLNLELTPSSTLISQSDLSPCLLSTECWDYGKAAKFHGYWRPELKSSSLDSIFFFYSQLSLQFSFLLKQDSLSHCLCTHIIITFICLHTLGCSFVLIGSESFVSSLALAIQLFPYSDHCLLILSLERFWFLIVWLWLTILLSKLYHSYP